MRTEHFSFTGYQNKSLPAMLWLPEGEPRLLLQITHGMTEHIGRYEAFARELTEQGIAVAGFDLRGHGKNPGDPGVASFGAEGWAASIEDMHLFFQLLEDRFPGIPHYLHGFSLGSFLLREYLGKYPDGVAGTVILGTGYQPALLLTLMRFIVKGQIKKVGFDGHSTMIRRLSFGVYNQKFKPTRTEKDWICSDSEQLALYLADPHCRENFSAGLFMQMLGAMKRTGSKDAYDTWNKELPILLLSGRNDPVGNLGKGVLAVKRRMEQAGLRNVTLHLFPDARHDVLHEEACGAAGASRKIIKEFLGGHL